MRCPARWPGGTLRSAGGRAPAKAIEVAITLEEVARMTLLTKLLEPGAEALQAAVRDKHHERKHGPQAYYGQA